MFSFKVRLFGKFSAECEGHSLEGIQGRRVQELFGYLLLFRKRAQSREALCEQLWGGHPPARSRKYLRQALWKLQSALRDTPCSEPDILADDKWIQINPSANYWLDVAEFENAFNLVGGKHIADLTPADVASIQSAIDHYKGDLLDGWYQDWCQFERERYQVMYLMLLDKMVEYCEHRGNYGVGLVYAAEILRHDRAYERAYRHMMWLYFMVGNRAQALQQYERCASALRADLDVEPSEDTRELFEQIRSGTLIPPAFHSDIGFPELTVQAASLTGMLDQLERFSGELSKMQTQIRAHLLALENPSLNSK